MFLKELEACQKSPYLVGQIFLDKVGLVFLSTNFYLKYIFVKIRNRILLREIRFLNTGKRKRAYSVEGA